MATQVPVPNEIKTGLIDVTKVKVRPGRRAPTDIADLVRSIEQIGLLNPITITPEYQLIAGGRRLAAFKSLGRTEIRACMVDLSALGAELAEIDENLCRNELTVLERAEQMSRRKDIYEAIHPETRRGVAGGKARQGKVNEMLSFADDTASKTRSSARTVQHEVQIAEQISEEVKQVIRGTPVEDRKADLVKLAQIKDKAEQKRVAEVVTQSPTPLTVPQAVQVIRRQQKRKELEERADLATVAPLAPAPHLYRITAGQMPWDGVEFEVDDEATEDEIAKAAWECVAQHVDFGWEEVDREEKVTDSATTVWQPGASSDSVLNRDWSKCTRCHEQPVSMVVKTRAHKTGPTMEEMVCAACIVGVRKDKSYLSDGPLPEKMPHPDDLRVGRVTAESAPVVRLTYIDNFPDAVSDILFRLGITTVPTLLEHMEAECAGLDLPLRNKLVTYLVKVGVKIKAAERAADAVSECIDWAADDMSSIDAAKPAPKKLKKEAKAK
jgi:ParB-like chromosome segregation protein Spo0J